MNESNPFASGAAFIDGDYVPIAEARIPITDWGFTHSDVTYDVAHVWKGSFFRLDDHLARFERSLASFRLKPPHTMDAIREILHECVRLTDLRDAYVQMGCTRGLPKPGSRDPRECVNRFYAFVVPFVWIATEEQRTRGLHLYISSVPRIAPESVDPRAKNFHRGDLTKGMFEAYDNGAETVVLPDGQGNITEGPGFNVFAVMDGRVLTPISGVLEGITRLSVIELCAEMDVPLEQTLLPVETLRGAEEIFLSSTAGGILPVTTLDGNPVGDGTTGTLTQKLHDLYWSKKEDGWHSTPVAYR